MRCSSHCGKAISLNDYHGVPRGWRAEELVAEHKRLSGTYRITGAEATEPGAPGWLPDRWRWLQYRATLYRIADGARANDPACVELAVRYIVLRYIGSYSGFVRSRLARALKHAPLTGEQQERLHHHFLAMLRARERTIEYTEIFQLWRRFLTDERKEEVLAEFSDRGEPTTTWLTARLWPER